MPSPSRSAPVVPLALDVIVAGWRPDPRGPELVGVDAGLVRLGRDGHIWAGAELLETARREGATTLPTVHVGAPVGLPADPHATLVRTTRDLAGPAGRPRPELPWLLWDAIRGETGQVAGRPVAELAGPLGRLAWLAFATGRWPRWDPWRRALVSGPLEPRAARRRMVRTA